MAKKKTESAAEEKPPEPAKPSEDGSVSAASAAKDMMKAWAAENRELDKEKLADALEAEHPGVKNNRGQTITREMWLDGISNARTALVSEGIVPPMRKRRSGSEGGGNKGGGEKREPTIADLRKVRTTLREEGISTEEAAKYITLTAKLAQEVGGLENLSEILKELVE